MNKYLFALLLVKIFCTPSYLSGQPDTIYFFDFETLKVDVDPKGDVVSSIINNRGEFQDALPTAHRTVAYGNSHSYKNAEFGNYPVGKLFLYHSPSWVSPDDKMASFNHIELRLDSALSPDTYYKFSFLVANMKSHRFKPSHYGVKFTKDKIIKDGQGKLLSEPDIFFRFTSDYEFEEIQAILLFDQPIQYIYFGMFREDSIRLPKKYPVYSSKPSYSDTAAYIQLAKPTRILIDNILIEKLDTINKNFRDIYYKVDEDEIYKAEDLKLVDVLRQNLKDNPDSYLLIQGSTDKTGSFAYNIDLSRRRAEKIKGILVDSGIDQHRIVTIGKGVDQSGDTKKDASVARRVSFLLLHS